VKVVALAGGTGGAKLAAGLQELVGEDLTVIANTGDDIEALGVYVSPDPDLCTYWLSNQINEEQGWGIRGDTFTVYERLKALGAPDWFGLSDRDLALCLERRRRLDLGERLTVIGSELAKSLGVVATILPMCDEPVRTRVRTPSGWRDFQEYLVHDQADPPIEEVEFSGIGSASLSREVRGAIEGAGAIIIGPSNPVISIGPILAIPGMSELLDTAPAPLVAVSPFVAGEVIKGPTDKFMRAVGSDPSVAGVAETYSEVIDALVVDAADPDPDPVVPGVSTIRFDTLMDGPAGRRDVAKATLDYATALAG
jgi:LPPG:FO 2-phospho-L-lactate transferase